MFDNIGEKIKKLAMILFIIGVVTSLVCAIVYGRTVEIYTYHTETKFNFRMFLPILVGGCIASYVGVMTLYGFGELIESNKKIVLLLNQSNITANQSEKENMYVADISNNITVSHESKKTLDGWNCPKCETFNEPSAFVCVECGRKRHQ